MNDPIPVNVRNTVGNMVGRAMVTDDHIRAIHARMLSMGLTFPAVNQTAQHCAEFGHSGPYINGKCETRADEQSTTASTPAVDGDMIYFEIDLEKDTMRQVPTPAVDDEATIDALEKAMFKAVMNGRCTAEMIIDAIRRGEVPGLMTAENFEGQVERHCTILHAEIKRLNARCDKEFTERMTAINEREKLKAEIAELKRLLFEVKDSAIVAERDTLKAEVERLRELASRQSSTVVELATEHRKRAEERDADRAAHAEAMAQVDAMKASGEAAVISERNNTERDFRRAEHFKSALVNMPCIALRFHTAEARDAWDEWKRKTFDRDGNPLEAKYGKDAIK